MSTILSEKKTLSPWAKGGIGLGAGALLLVLVGLLFPTAAAFFPLVSLWCSCVLFYGALWVLHTAGVELDFFHRAAIIAFWAGAVLYFYWALGRRQFIYAWDCPEHRRRLPVPPRFHHRGLHQLHPPVHRVPILPHRKNG